MENNGLSLKEFKKIMTDIENQLELDDKLTDLLVCKDTTGWITAAPDLVCDLVSLAERLLNDKDEWISWWLWELADDKSNAHVTSKDESGQNYKYTIKTHDDLYYLIIDNMDKISMKEPCEDEDEPLEEGVYVHAEGDSLYDIFKVEGMPFRESDN